MSAKERLSLDEIAAGDLIAAHHVHRYELAAAMAGGGRVLDLCCGTGYGSFVLAEAARQVVGVDLDADAIAEARRAESQRDVQFVVEDALRYLQGLEPGAFDAIVCFEGIEHVPDPEAVADALSSHAAAGTRVILSFPNSRAFREENEFHVTDFGYEEILALLERFHDPIVLRQYLAEGSVVVGPESTEASVGLQGTVPHLERAEPEWANHYIAIVGSTMSDVGLAAGRFRLAADPSHNAYMRALEQANAVLRRTNARLGREAYGQWDAAAASALARAEEQEQRLAAAVLRAERAEYSAWENDLWLTEERRRNRRLRRLSSAIRRVTGGQPGRTGL